MPKTSIDITLASQKVVDSPSKLPAKVYRCDDFLEMLKRKSRVSVKITVDHDNYGSPNRAHSIWVGSEFPPDPTLKPKTKGFAENVASLKQHADYNHVLWFDITDFNNLPSEKQKITTEYCEKNQIALVAIQDIFPNPEDEIETNLYRIYSVEHAELNMAAAADAARVMLLRRFRGLYIDVDISVIKKIPYDYFSSSLLQIPVEGNKINNCILSSPRDNNEIELAALAIIKRHALPLKELLTSKIRIWTDYGNNNGFYSTGKTYLLIPYHFIRFARTIIATGPDIFFTMYLPPKVIDISGDFFTLKRNNSAVNLNSSTQEPDLYADEESKKRIINLDCFAVQNVGSWVGDSFSYEYHSFPISEYRLSANNSAETAIKIENFTMYYHCLENRTIRFDFYRANVFEIYIQNQINLEDIVFNRLLRSGQSFYDVEFIYFNLFETFEKYWKFILNKKIFPKLNHGYYIPELLFLAKKHNIDLATVELLDKDVLDVIENKTYRDVYQSEWCNFARTKAITDLIDDKHDSVIFPNFFQRYSNQYLTGTSTDRQYFINLLRSSQIKYVADVDEGTAYSWQGKYILPVSITDKIIEESDAELLRLLTDNKIGLAVKDKDSYQKLVKLANPDSTENITLFYLNDHSFTVALENKNYDYINFLCQISANLNIVNPDVIADLITNNNISQIARDYIKNCYLKNYHLILKSIQSKNLALLKILAENNVTLLLSTSLIKPCEELHELCKNDPDLQSYFENELMRNTHLFTAAVCNRRVSTLSLFYKNNILISKTYFGVIIHIVCDPSFEIDVSLRKYLITTAKKNNPLSNLIDITDKDLFKEKVLTAVNQSLHCFVSLVMVQTFFRDMISSKFNYRTFETYFLNNDISPLVAHSFFPNSNHTASNNAAYVECIKVLQFIYVSILECTRDQVLDKNIVIVDYTNVVNSIEYTNRLSTPNDPVLLDFTFVEYDTKSPETETDYRKQANQYISEMTVAIKCKSNEKIETLTDSKENTTSPKGP